MNYIYTCKIFRGGVGKQVLALASLCRENLCKPRCEI